jgi:hypothetical protein
VRTSSGAKGVQPWSVRGPDEGSAASVHHVRDASGPTPRLGDQALPGRRDPAVSIARIIADADVALMTLYRHFSGKDELVGAAVKRWSVRWLKWLEEQLDACGPDPDARLDALWNALGAWSTSEQFGGSLVVSAAIELRGSPTTRFIRRSSITVWPCGSFLKTSQPPQAPPILRSWPPSCTSSSKVFWPPPSSSNDRQTLPAFVRWRASPLPPAQQGSGRHADRPVLWGAIASKNEAASAMVVHQYWFVWINRPPWSSWQEPSQGSELRRARK